MHSHVLIVTEVSSNLTSQKDITVSTLIESSPLIWYLV
jgi:hypothetical protein